MKKEFPYKQGDIITIYEDWEHELKPLGPARLVNFHSYGRSFILEEMLPEDTQIVYNYEIWEVEYPKAMTNPPRVLIPNELRKIRYIDTIGIANSTVDDEDSEYEPLNLPIDRFLEVNGKQIY